VEPGSIGEELGFQPGDRLLSINGQRPRDLIDLQFLVGEEELVLEVEDPNGSRHRVELEKDFDEGLGLGFTEALFDGLKQCNNACPFCFIDQQPPGKRRSLTTTGSASSTAPISPSPTSAKPTGAGLRPSASRLSTCRCTPPSPRCAAACW